jgi:hypothetical protein
MLAALAQTTNFTNCTNPRFSWNSCNSWFSIGMEA